MINFLKTVLYIINIISFCCVIVFAIFGVYEQIMGPAEAERLLKKLNIPLSCNQVFLLAIIFVVIMMGSHFARKKLSGEW